MLTSNQGLEPGGETLHDKVMAAHYSFQVRPAPVAVPPPRRGLQERQGFDGRKCQLIDGH